MSDNVDRDSSGSKSLVQRVGDVDTETWFRIAFAVLAAAVAVTIWLVSVFNDPGVNGWWKLAIGALLGALVLMMGVGVVSWLSKRSETVERWTYAVAVLVSATLFTTAPMVVLDRTEQSWGLAVLVTWMLTLLPGFMYLQFRAVRGRTLLEEFVTTLQRLKVTEYGPVPDVEALLEPPAPHPGAGEAAAALDPHHEAMQNLYVRKFENVFGAPPVAARRGRHVAPSKRRTRLRGDTLWPILWVTILVAVGWSAVLAPDSIFGLRPFGSEFAFPDPAGAQDALRFGFLGSYFYVIQMLVRRYFQKDLKPDAYVSAILRLATVPLLVVVLHTIGFGNATGTTSGTELAAAFLIGVFPQVGLEVIRATVAAVFGRLVPSLRAEYPLSEIDGLNLFYESRLLEEGIEDMQNLATADFVDLLLHTRIPIGRLVDWIDQAHLFVRMQPKVSKQRTESATGGGEAGSAGGAAPAQPHDWEHPQSVLRRYGVRCATDLELAFGGDSEIPPELGARLPGLPFVLKTLEREPNMMHVRAWKGRAVGGHGDPPTASATAA